MFHLKIHLKAGWQLEEWASTFLALRHLWSLHSVACRTRQCYDEKQSAHVNIPSSTLADTQTYTTPACKDNPTCTRDTQIHKIDPPQQHTPTLARARTRRPQMFPRIQANSLGKSSIPFWFYNGKFCPLTWSIFNIQESSSRGMPCLSAERWDGLMSIIYVSAVAG